MDSEEFEVEYPDQSSDCRLDQHEEWITVRSGGKCRRIRIHDYSRFYKIPGLYEEVIYRHLKCISPHTVCEMLKKEVKQESGDALRVLDFGAGNGMVGECLQRELSCEYLAGVDIIDEARAAALRDRGSVYDEYWVMDLSRIDENVIRKFSDRNFNTLVTVAALGFDDIPTQAFVNALNMVKKGAWVAFNIKESFLSGKDKSGYGELIETVLGKSIRVLNTKHYRHRLSLSGEPLYYLAVVGKKAGRIDWRP